MWIDKYCINQKDVAEDLMCLPVFLAGCQKLVILCGDTYLERLWCIMEMTVFLYMGGTPETVHLRTISQAGATFGMTSFSVAQAKCSNESDKQMLLAVVEAGFGGAASFNKLVISMMTTLLGRPSSAALTESFLHEVSFR